MNERVDSPEGAADCSRGRQPTVSDDPKGSPERATESWEQCSTPNIFRRSGASCAWPRFRGLAPTATFCRPYRGYRKFGHKNTPRKRGAK